MGDPLPKKKDISEKDLSTIISSAMVKKKELEEMIKRKEKIISDIVDLFTSEQIDHEKLSQYADSLFMISEWEKGENRLTRSLESKLYILLIYKFLDDKEHLEKILETFNQLLDQIKNETLSWKDYDRAFLFEVYGFLRDLIVYREEAKVISPEYISLVYPNIRDLPKTIVLYLKKKINKEEFVKSFKDYEEFASKNNLMEQLEIIKNFVPLIQAYWKMTGAVSDQTME